MEEEAEAKNAAAWQRGRRALGMAAALLAGTHLNLERRRPVRLMRPCWHALVLHMHGARSRREAERAREEGLARRGGDAATLARELAQCDAAQEAVHSAAWGVVGRAAAAEAGRGEVERRQLRRELAEAEAEGARLLAVVRQREQSLDSLATAARESKLAVRRGVEAQAARVQAEAEASVARVRLECEAALKRVSGQREAEARARQREREAVSSALHEGDEAAAQQRQESAAREQGWLVAAAEAKAAAEARLIEVERRAAAERVAAESEHAERLGAAQRQLQQADPTPSLTRAPVHPSPLTPHPTPLTPRPSPRPTLCSPTPHPSPHAPHPSPLTPHP